MKSKAEKRKSARYQCLVPVESNAGSPFSKIRTTDISQTGIGFISACAISVSEKIPIELALNEEGEAVLVMGEVKWVQPLSAPNKYRVGLTFTSMLQGKKSRLSEYLSR